ncbi:MAG: hypothetical protein Q8S33_05345 [Myxococcales bacterium]|nr:hypothetical protein [Myxococcales bacterium]
MSKHKPPGWVVSSQTARTGSYKELGPLCEALGVSCSGAPEERLRINRTQVTISLRIDSGTVVGVALETKREPVWDGVSISLTKETAVEVAAKQAGISREVQLGDPEFDVAVYVDTAASDDEVKRVLQQPHVRRGALKLIKQLATHVFIGKDRVTASFEDRANLFHAQTMISLLSAMLDVTSGGVPMGPAMARPGGTLSWLLVVTWLAAVVAAWLSFSRYAISPWLTFGSAAVGLLLFLPLSLLLRHTIRGASNSHDMFSWVRAFVFLNLVTGGVAGARLANCALDSSEGLLVSGTVSSMTTSEDSGKTSATIEWTNGVRTSEEVVEPMATGDTIERPFFRGRLGAAWTWKR